MMRLPALTCTSVDQVGHDLTIEGRCLQITSVSDFVAALARSKYFKKTVELINTQVEPTTTPGAPELIKAVGILKAKGLEQNVKLFHFHVGSQLTDIRTVKDVVNEGARFYAKLRKMGLALEYFDVGGGLGVDYVGARSTAYVSSLNYSMEEYAADVVYTLQQICANEDVPEPHLVSESDRARRRSNPGAHRARQPRTGRAPWARTEP